MNFSTTGATTSALVSLSQRGIKRDYSIRLRGLQHFYGEGELKKQVLFDNQDPNVNHDWDVLDASGKKVFDSKDFPGVAQKTLDVPALPAGTYKFECSIHPGPTNGQLKVGG